MIRKFADKDTETGFRGRFSKKLPQEIQRAALRKLVQLHATTSLDFLRVPPANRLEKLSGDRAQQWSIRINDQWRIGFEWRDGNAWDVGIVDYH